MKKLGKTAAAILARMKASRHGSYSGTWAWGHGAYGGMINEGLREFTACEELVEKGYVVETGRNSNILYKNGWGLHCVHISIKLPA